MSGDVGAADRVSGMRHVLGAITQQKQCDSGAMFEQRLPWKLYFDYERTNSFKAPVKSGATEVYRCC